MVQRGKVLAVPAGASARPPESTKVEGENEVYETVLCQLSMHTHVHTALIHAHTYTYTHNNNTHTHTHTTFRKLITEMDMVVHTFNPNRRETKAGGSL